MSVENKLRKLLLPVFGLNSIDDVQPRHSLITDLGAESLDFVEIFHLIDRTFGVELTVNSMMAGGKNIKTDELFEGGKLNSEGLNLLQSTFYNKREKLFTGMNKVQLFSLITVSDLAMIIESKIQTQAKNAEK